jgi:hypothetical protein
MFVSQRAAKILRRRSKTHLDDTVWDALLLAEGWQPDDQLQWVHIMRNYHKLSLTALNKLCDVVEAVLDHHRLLLVNLLNTECC